MAGFMEGLASAGLGSIPGVLRPEDHALVRDPWGLITEVSCDLGSLRCPPFLVFRAISGSDGRNGLRFILVLGIV